MIRRKFKVIFAIFALILVLGDVGTPVTAKENTPVSKTLTVEPRALGDTIAQTFPDTRMAQAVADQIAGGNVNTVIDINLVNSTGLLALHAKDISSIEGIGVFSELISLSMPNNELTEIPAEIGNLTNLQGLNLDNNKITALPVEIGNLNKLLSLGLDNNELTELPAEIGDLSKLEVLYSANNQITELPAEIGNLSKLMYLKLSNNQITEVPTEIDNLTNLIMLHLANNQIIDLPQDRFDFITSLYDFDLHNQSYTENLSTPGTLGTDYEFDGLPAYEQFPNYGMTFEYVLELPDGTTTPINPNIVDGKVTIAGSDLPQVGSYILVANGTGGALEPVTFTTNFSVEDDAPAMYTVVFDPDNGTSYNEWESIDVVEGELVPNTATIPQKEGYTFIGWASAFDDENNPILWNFETDVMPSHNITLWASYEEVVDNGDNNGNENNGNENNGNNGNNGNNNGNDNTNPDDEDLSKLPQTGDGSGAFALMLLLAGSLLGSGYFLTRKREQ